MKKIFRSIFTLSVVGLLLVGATRAFFSDTETSTENRFVAGAIDLLIDNDSYAIDWNIPGYNNPNGSFVASTHTSWTMTDLDDELFFDFEDLKPGDYGEDTISLHVTNNDAYACMDINLTSTPENGLTDPESADDETAGDNEGELQEELNFVFWADDGDNVFEVGEEQSIIAEGTAGAIFDGSSWTLADSTKNVWSGTGPLTGSDDLQQAYYVGKFWCFGDLAKNPVEEGVSPIQATGFTCNGEEVGNRAQTDGIYADVNFYAVQARHNTDFTCASLNTEPQWHDVGTRTGGEVSFVEDESRGTVLQLTTTADNDSRVRWTNDNLNHDLSTFTGVSFDSKQVVAPNPLVSNVSMRLFIDLDGDTNTADVQEITYEPYYNIQAHNPLNDVAMTLGNWHNWKTTLANGKFWGNGGFLGTTPGGGAYATNITLQQVLDAYPSAKVVGISLGMGTYNPGQVILVDNLVVNGSPLSLEN